MERTYTARREHRQLRLRGAGDDFAEVTLRARPCEGPSEVVLAPAVLESLRAVFGADFEHHRHCVWSAVAVIISLYEQRTCGTPPGAVSIHVEVCDVRVSRDAGRELSGVLLSSAAMAAIEAYLDTL